MTEPITQTSTEDIAAQNTETRSQQRIQELSEKVELTSKERDEKDRLLKEMGEKYSTLEKENTFNSGFADILGSHPAAKDHKDEIKTKVFAGYSTEDAALAVLAKAGKLSAQPSFQQQIAGGSASTVMPQNGEKPVQEMTQAERREKLSKELIFS